MAESIQTHISESLVVAACASNHFQCGHANSLVALTFVVFSVGHQPN